MFRLYSPCIVLLLGAICVSSSPTTLQRDAKDVRLDDIPPNGLIEKYFNKRENLDQYEDHPSQRMNELIPEERNVWRDLSKLEKYHKLHYIKRLRPNEEDSTKELVGAERLAEPIPENSSPLRNIDNELDLRVANYITNYLRSEGLSAGAEDVLDRDEDLPEPQRRFIARKFGALKPGDYTVLYSPGFRALDFLKRNNGL